MSKLITFDPKKPYKKALGFSEGARVYAKLRSDVTKAGVLKRSYWYYLFLSVTDIGSFLICWYLLVVQSHPVVVVLSIIGIAFFSVRMGGLIHDAAHRAIFKSVTVNDIFGYLTSFVIAFPYRVWRVKHNAHHAHTNEEGEDPDVEVPISFTETTFRRNTFVVRNIRRNQAWLYYVLGPLLSFSIRLKSFKYYAANFKGKIPLEVAILLCGLVVWYVMPFVFFPFWKAMLFLIIVNALSGFYMLNIFAPNHKGMPYLAKGVKFSFLEHQIMTARNLYRHWLTDYVYLGLNYQIEHHLFPDCPRNKLHRVTPFVKKICKKYGMDYTETSIIETNKIIYRELKKISQTAIAS